MRRWLPILLLCLVCFCVLTGDARQESIYVRVTATAYSSGTITASGLRVRPGHIALSRDVEGLLHARFGDAIVLEGIGTFEFQDRMPWYWHRRVDLYLPPKSRAMQFGIKRHVILSMRQALPASPL